MNQLEAMQLAARLHVAHILTAQQVVSEPSAALPPHLLHVSLPSDVVLAFEKRGTCSPSFTLVPLQSGAMLAIATIQAGGLQLRTLVPFVDPVALAWLDSCVKHGGFGWLVDVHDRDETILLTTDYSLTDHEELGSLAARGRRPSDEELAFNLAMCSIKLANPKAVASSLAQVDVSRVHVCTVWQPLEDPAPKAAIGAALSMLAHRH